MERNAEPCIKLILAHEGEYVNHPKDPGAATNRGVTIGTLRSLGMDLDGDGDVDINDLKRLTEADAAKVYKRFYWDKVEADFLPSGVDYAVADFAVNSGPNRAARYLQAVLGVVQDGDIGPVTIEAALQADPKETISALCDKRLRFLKSLKTWPTFGKGWSRRVSDVRAKSIGLAKVAERSPPLIHAEPAEQPQGILAAIVAAILSIFGGKK